MKKTCMVKNCKESGMKHVKHGKEIFLSLCEKHSDWLIDAMHRRKK